MTALKLLEASTEYEEIDLTDIDLSNINENISNAGKILSAIVDKIGEYLAEAGLNLIVAAIVFVVGWKLINLLSKKIKEGKAFTRIEPTAKSFLRSFLTIALKIMLLLTVAAIIGIPMNSVVTIISSCGIAIGLALQDSLSNIAGGFIITFFKPFSVGDFVKAGEYEGTVKSINIFYTKIITPDNKIVVIPNRTVSDSAITDYNAFETRRIDISVGASYGADAEDVKQALLAAARLNENVLANPEPTAVITSFDDSAVTYQLKAWCETDKYWDTRFNLMENIKKIFEERDIQIPFPQMDIHLDGKC